MDADKNVKVNKGLVGVLILSLIPMFAWLIGYEFPYDTTWQNLAVVFAKIGAFGGMAMFALSLLLSGRYRIYDRIFGGLDKMYIAHRFLGTFSLVLLFIHPVSLAIAKLGVGVGDSLSIWFSISDLGVLIGALAFYAFVALILWSIFGKAKYETFVKVHRLLGVVFIAGAVHAFMAGSVLGSNSFMYWYMLVLSVAGGVTFVVYSILNDLLHRPLRYTLRSITEHGSDIVELQLEPGNRILNFSPGQFVYISFDELADHGFHPFSISSRKNSTTLRLAIREAGDFTSQLASLRPGAKARIKGPYGAFILRTNRKRKQLWIAGGIGVTPFLAGASSLPQSSRNVTNDIEMFYASDDEHPYGLETLQHIEDINDIFNVTHFHKDSYGFVTFEKLGKQIKDLAERDIYICGPGPMLEALKKEARELGFENNLKYEEFSF